MTSPAARILDRELTTIVERLAVDFPQTPVETIRRAVESATPPARQCDVRELSSIIARVEGTARESLVPLDVTAA
jgi:hypothetical protein